MKNLYPTFILVLTVLIFHFETKAQVGINTDTPQQALDVDGKLQIGDDGMTPTEGTIRYNFFSQTFEGYNGTNWSEFSNELNTEDLVPQGAILHFDNKQDRQGYTYIGSVSSDYFVFLGVSTGSWETLTPISTGLIANYRTKVFYNNKLYLWSGQDPSYLSYENTGAYYNIGTETWTAMSTNNAPVGRYHNVTAVNQSDGEFYIWGGITNHTGAGTIKVPTNTGGKYNMNTDTWSAITNGPLAARTSHAGVWVGDKMVIWGGYNSENNTIYSDGAAYNPTTNTWSAIAASPLSARYGHSAVWTGTAMIIYGGTNGTTVFNDGASYNPTTNTWTLINSNHGKYNHSITWTGTEMLLAGGISTYGGATSNVSVYNPSSNSWINSPYISGASAAGFENHEAVWTGSKLIIFGGINSSQTYGRREVYVYNKASNSWEFYNKLPVQMIGPSGIFTGGKLLIHAGSRGLSTQRFYEFNPNGGTDTDVEVPQGRFFYLYKKD